MPWGKNNACYSRKSWGGKDMNATVSTLGNMSHQLTNYDTCENAALVSFGCDQQATAWLLHVMLTDQCHQTNTSITSAVGRYLTIYIQHTAILNMQWKHVNGKVINCQLWCKWNRNHLPLYHRWREHLAVRDSYGCLWPLKCTTYHLATPQDLPLPLSSHDGFDWEEADIRRRFTVIAPSTCQGGQATAHSPTMLRISRVYTNAEVSADLSGDGLDLFF